MGEHDIFHILLLPKSQSFLIYNTFAQLYCSKLIFIRNSLRLQGIHTLTSINKLTTVQKIEVSTTRVSVSSKDPTTGRWRLVRAIMMQSEKIQFEKLRNLKVAGMF